ncbi:unnamed protein product [Choristocarpus tenellus]
MHLSTVSQNKIQIIIHTLPFDKLPPSTLSYTCFIVRFRNLLDVARDRPRMRCTPFQDNILIVVVSVIDESNTLLHESGVSSNMAVLSVILRDQTFCKPLPPYKYAALSMFAS